MGALGRLRDAEGTELGRGVEVDELESDLGDGRSFEDQGGARVAERQTRHPWVQERLDLLLCGQGQVGDVLAADDHGGPGQPDSMNASAMATAVRTPAQALEISKARALRNPKCFF